MQITIKSAKVLKRGTNDYGPWALVKVVTDKDAEYTTLNKDAESISAGMDIAIDEISIEEKDGKEKRSFKKFEIVSNPMSIHEHGFSKPEGDMTPDMWAEKDRITRRSIERQKSIEIAASLPEIKTIPKLLDAADYIYHWISDQITPEKPQDTGETSPKEKVTLTSAMKTSGYSNEEVKAHIVEKYGKENSKDLTPDELKELFSDVVNCQITKTVDPADLPF